MRQLPLFLFAALALFSGLQADNRNFLLQNTQPKHIFVQNRILAQVHGKPISVIDVMKKMDMVFYQRFPQYASSVEARYQFYMVSWKQVLKELVEKELMMSDAVELKVEISKGDVRQEMESLFGPNIIASLDRAGLSYEEASEIVREDLLLKKMMGMRVHGKAVRSITPKQVREAYEQYAKENRSPDRWSYRVISVKGEDWAECAKRAALLYQELSAGRLSMADLSPNEGSVSQEYTVSDKELSEAYRKTLTMLTPGSFSAPVEQKTKKKEVLFRIFYLKDFQAGGTPSFQEMEAKLKNQLIEQRVNQEGELYIQKLKRQFIVHQEAALLVDDDFEPFELK